jgi:phosphate/sulfate permease
MKTVAFIFISPLLGFILGSLFMLGVSWLFSVPRQARSTGGSGGSSWCRRPLQPRPRR